MSQLRTHIAACVQHPVFIKDPVLKEGTLFRKESGGVLSWNGGFSSVFKIESKGKIWAVKIWHTPLDNMAVRYSIIKEYLEQFDLTYFVSFDYVENGLYDGEKHLDIHRMKWVEGLTLDQYIEKNLYNPDKLLKVAEKFRIMMRDLYSYNISHGDLQHGNIIVDENDNLYIIDYDSMFVNGLEGMPDIVNGQAGYQHPKRYYNQFVGNYLDNFSGIVIFLSLQVYSEKPELWNVDTDWFLFSKEDLESPDECLLFQDLLKSENTLIKYLAGAVYKHLSCQDIKLIPNLEQLLDPNGKKHNTIVNNIIDKF